MKYTDKQIIELLYGIVEGIITVNNLPKDLYIAIAEYLKKGLYEGFGGTLVDFGGKDLKLLKELRENIYIFSGAKTYQQVRELTNLVAEAQTFSDYKKKAIDVYDTYNKVWAEAEYNTAKGQAQNAILWSEFEKDKKNFPYLKYSAVIDKNTSDICKPLNGVIRKVDDQLWNKYSPLNHFNCRCTLEKIDKYDDVVLTPKYKVDDITKELDKTVQNEFKMNPGKDGYIFNENHPYFTVKKEHRGLARQNFGLEIPEKD
jgi:SPP1 gp7 family putative phage head morphogenesis protein